MTKLTLTTTLKDWKFWFKLLFGLSILGCLIWQYTTGMLGIDKPNSKGEYLWAFQNITNDGNTTINYDYSGFTVYFFSFFTIQSNLLVAIWFLAAAFTHSNEGKNFFTRHYFSIGVATYISITSLIFNFVLLPPAISQNQVSGWGATGWIQNEWLHTFGPIALVLYVVLFLNKDEILDNKTFWKLKNWKYILYPLCYGVYILIRGELRYRSGKMAATQYPYFFLEIHKNGGDAGYPIKGLPIPGWVWFIIVVIIIAAISLGFATLYNFAANKLNKNKK